MSETKAENEDERVESGPFSDVADELASALFALVREGKRAEAKEVDRLAYAIEDCLAAVTVGIAKMIHAASAPERSPWLLRFQRHELSADGDTEVTPMEQTIEAHDSEEAAAWFTQWKKDNETLGRRFKLVEVLAVKFTED